MHEEDVKLYQLNEEAQPSENKEADEEKGKMTRSTSDEADTAAAAEKIESKPKKETKKETKKEPKKKADSLNSNNLIIIEGIGQKVNQYLETAGITSFSQLAASNFETLKGILVANRLQFLDPTSWPQQAQLVVEGKMDDLKTLQEQLKSGRKK